MIALTHLPSEILYNIIHHVSTDNEEYLRAHRLACLSRTCKLLRDLVQPALYRYLRANHRNIVSLLRTLCERPDLAQMVKEWKRDVPLSHEGASEDEISLFNEQLEKYFGTRMQEPPFLEFGDDESSEANDDDGDDDDPEIDALGSLIICLVPNIVTLTISKHYETFPSFPPASLPHLTELNVSFDDSDGGISLEDFQPILATAPILRTLNCDTVGSIPDNIAHPNITTLNLAYSNIGLSELKAAVRGFPKLESFSYDYGPFPEQSHHDDELLPKEVSRILKMRKNTMKHLNLDLSDVIYYEDPDEPVESFASMEALETITLCNVGIYPAVSQQDPPTNGERLTGILPKNIRKVCVYKPHEHLLRDFERLAEVAAKSFPKLEEVRIQRVSSDVWKGLSAAFDWARIRLVVDIRPTNYGNATWG